jgi:hypothetical protein
MLRTLLYGVSKNKVHTQKAAILKRMSKEYEKGTAAERANLRTIALDNDVLIYSTSPAYEFDVDAL